MIDDPGFFDQFHKGPGAAIKDGWLLGIHGDEGIVHAHAGEGREDMLDGVKLDCAFDQGGGTLDRFDVFDPGFHDGLVRQIGPLELISVIGRGRMDGERYLFAGMQGGAVKAG